jgi:hypothetical protein
VATQDEPRARTTVRSWREGQAWKADLLERRTGHDVAWWNERVEKQNPSGADDLRTWLRQEGVTGYPLDLLVMERFGYPEFLKKSPEELIDEQYADREGLRPILDRLLEATRKLGEVTVQTRKGYISLVSPRRTFASIQPTTKDRLDLGLRLPGEKPKGRLETARSIGQSAMTHKIGLSSEADVNAEVRDWLRRAFDTNS